MVYTIAMTVKINLKDQQYLGIKLREIREQRGFSQEEVANSAGISITYYAGIERGEENPTFAVVGALCKTLRIKSSEIFPF
jgi:transcriptional regulator with XRE-family HTH domain